MIFVTVGAQMPFDRLVRTVDRWALERDRRDVVAQIGESTFRPQRLQVSGVLEPAEFRRRCLHADAIVTHAGMGTILSALELGRPIVVMPRRAQLRETRNDHQLATARAFERTRRVTVAWNEDDLFDALDRIDRLTPPPRVPSHASIRLLETLRRFIGDPAPPPALAA